MVDRWRQIDEIDLDRLFLHTLPAPGLAEGKIDEGEHMQADQRAQQGRAPAPREILARIGIQRMRLPVAAVAKLELPVRFRLHPFAAFEDCGLVRTVR